MQNAAAVGATPRLTEPLARELPALRFLEESLQSDAAAGMTQLSQRLGFDLPDTLARDGEILADLFERVFIPVFEPEAQTDNSLFTGRQRLQHFGCLFVQVQIDDLIRRRHVALIDN